jgi:putative membrane protein
MELLTFSAVLSAVHLLALALGLPSIFLRSRALRGKLDEAGLNRLFTADLGWGIAAGLWLVSGVLRAFTNAENGGQFYLASRFFELKMILFLTILLLEIWPMVTFIRWRIQKRKGKLPNTAAAPRLYVVSVIQTVLIVVMVFVAAFMARGAGFYG